MSTRPLCALRAGRISSARRAAPSNLLPALDHDPPALLSLPSFASTNMARVTAIGIKKRKYVASDPSESPFAAQDAAAAAAAASVASSAPPPSATPAPAPKAAEPTSQPAASTSTAGKKDVAAPVEEGEPSAKKHKKQHRGTRGRKHKLPEKASPTLALLAASAPATVAAAAIAGPSVQSAPPRANAASMRPPKGMTGSNEGAKGDSGWGARTQAPTFNAEGRKTMAGLEGPKPSESQVGYEARVAAREARKEGIKSGKGGTSCCS